MQVQFFFPAATVLKQRNHLKQFIAGIFKREGFKLDRLTYIFCSDEYLLEINKQYLNHNFYTDIITFDLSEGEKVTGEIYISVDRVKDNAQAFEVSQRQELHRVIFHGALHLCGLKDKSAKDARLMRAAEDRYLKLYFGSVQ